MRKHQPMQVATFEKPNSTNVEEMFWLTKAGLNQQS
jgi:hypothetical protein